MKCLPNTLVQFKMPPVRVRSLTYGPRWNRTVHILYQSELPVILKPPLREIEIIRYDFGRITLSSQVQGCYCSRAQTAKRLPYYVPWVGRGRNYAFNKLKRFLIRMGIPILRSDALLSSDCGLLPHISHACYQ